MRERENEGGRERERGREGKKKIEREKGKLDEYVRHVMKKT